MLSVAAMTAHSGPTTTRPHLVFALIDDWGWFDVGFRNPLIKTPVIDTLVQKEAALLERHYTFKFCSPTRRSFLSGRVPPHSGQDNSAGATVDLRMTTIADKLASAGYVTGQAGKWHAGHSVVKQTPHGRGFHTSLGYFNGACDHYSQKDGEDRCEPSSAEAAEQPAIDWLTLDDTPFRLRTSGSSTDLWNTDEPGYGLNGTYGDLLYVGRAVDTILAHDTSKPLFFYLAMQCAHMPMQSPGRFQALYDAASCPDVLEYSFSSVIDEGIGNVTAALKAKAMWRTTLMVVSSDNGGPAFSDQRAASNYPLRGGKYTYFEGGLRTTAFVTGGLLPAPMRGTNVSAPIAVADWYATFCGLAGVDSADNQRGVPPIDSVDQWPLLAGGDPAAATGAQERELFLGSGVLMQGRYKLIATGAGTAQWSGPLFPKVAADGPPKLGCSPAAPCLFDVVADPSERLDLAPQSAARVANMSARLAVLMGTVFEGEQPQVPKGAVCAATARNGGYLTPSDWKAAERATPDPNRAIVEERAEASLTPSDGEAVERATPDPSPASIEERAEAILAKLTTEEVIQQTWSPYGGSPAALLDKIGQGGVGQVAFKICGGGTLEARVRARNQLQREITNASRHRIPASFSNEALHGGVAGGTVFPELATQGATWDPALVEEIGAAIASEARAVGVDTAFSPVLNMWVDSRFGRLQEGYSENPTLTSAYAVAQVSGLQGEQPQGAWAPFEPRKVVALGKHYAAYGAALGGLNGAPAQMSERTLREFFLPPWRAFARAGGKAVMASHNAVLGLPMHANAYVTNTILRDEFGFGDGYVLSDCNDVPALVSFRVAANLSHAAAKGIAGGVDLDLQCGGQSAYTTLNQSLADGITTLGAVRAAAKRVLMSKLALGLFDAPPVDAAAAAALVNTPAHQALALRAAEEGVVLLKNDGGLLPLGARVGSRGSIAVVGPNGGCDAGGGASCDGRVQLLGSYTQYDGTVEVQTVAEALASEAPGGVRVAWSLGATAELAEPTLAAARRKAAVELANASDTVVAVLGDDSRSASEWGDRASLDLPGDQLALLAALAATGKPLVAVLVTGRTATFGAGNALLARVPAMLSAFRPGQMGGVAIARLLLGKSSPSGRLAQNWARSAGQAMSGASPWLQYRVGKWVANARSPPDPDGRVYDGYNDEPGTPLFHFGHGLTYSNFTMSGLSVTQAPAVLHGGGSAPASPSTALRVSLRLANTGTVAAAEVVQVYCIDPVMDYVRPWKRLLTFKRVPLAAGASTTVTIDVAPEQLAFQDDSSAAGAWRVVGGDYQIRVGPSSVEDTLVASVTIKE